MITPHDRRPGRVSVHRTDRLLPSDVWNGRGLRVVSPALTLLQIAPTLSQDRLVRIYTELRVHRSQTEAQLRDLLQRFPRHPGGRYIRALLDSPLKDTRSRFEVDWVEFAKTYGLAPYKLNVVLHGVRVDVLFTPNLLIVELDGWDLTNPLRRSPGPNQRARCRPPTRYDQRSSD